MSEIMVSIVCITYNQEDYIGDTLDGFLKQSVNFKYEIIIHDDASTDKTAEIVRKYEAKYPGVIHAICRKENQYSKTENFSFLRSVYALCKGNYIALCEGDDLWIDAEKLQRQVDFMERSPDYFLTIHNAVRLYCSDYKIQGMNTFICDKEVTPEELIMLYNGMIPTASMLMRTDVVKMEKFFWECEVGDWPLQLYCLTRGKIYYFSRIMSVYRSFHRGSWSMAWDKSIQERFQHSIAMIGFLEKYNQYTNCIYNSYIFSRIQRYVYDILDTAEQKDKEFFLEVCDKYREESVYIKEIKRLFMLLFDESYQEEKISRFVKRYKHIVLFGAGDYALKLFKKLKYQNIFFDGFVVSERKIDKKEYLDKPVWNFGEIPFAMNETGIIVAIKPIKWHQLVEILEENGVTEYMCPFLYNI